MPCLPGNNVTATGVSEHAVQNLIPNPNQAESQMELTYAQALHILSRACLPSLAVLAASVKNRRCTGLCAPSERSGGKAQNGEVQSAT